MGAPARLEKSETEDEEPRRAVANDEVADDRTLASATSSAAIDEVVKKDDPGKGEEKGEEKLAGSDVVVADEVVDPDAGKKLTLGGYGHFYVKGEILWDIAKHYYGDGKYWPKIKAANPDKIKKGLKEGDILDIPPVELDTLTALLRFKDQPDQLKYLVMFMPHADYEGFFASLTPKQIDKHCEFLQVLELMRATGKTVKELAADQRKWLKEEADKQGKDVGAAVGETVEEEGYGGSPTPIWDGTKASDRKEWKRRFHAVVKSLKDSAPEDVKEIITTAEAKGGGFRWSPKEIEANGAFAYTQLGWDLHCGFEWVKAAEKDPTLVYGNISHEMGGHNYYGNNELGYAIQKGALTKAEEKKAEASGNSIYSAYGYMETEIFAELYEYKYNLANQPDKRYPSDTAFDTNKEGEKVNASSENPLGDVYHQLGRIKAAFEPGVAEGLVASLTRRVKLDPRILPEAKERYYEAVAYVFPP